MVTVIIQTCDKYQKFWEGWFHFFPRFWDFTNGWRACFCVENVEPAFRHPGVEIVKLGSGMFSDRYIKALELVSTEYYLYGQEDMWPFRAMEKGLPAELHKLQLELDIPCVRIHNFRSFNYTLEATDLHVRQRRLLRYSPHPPHGAAFSHQYALWKKDFALPFIVPNEDPWKNEVNCTRRLCQRHPEVPIYVYPFSWYAVRGVSSNGQFNDYGRFMRELMTDEKAGAKLLEQHSDKGARP